ncbi:hypothetical protein L6R53_09390 [Myxococcota bacterium]|nr:hypothetical protein [Myxococcota bacterium]
MSTPPRDHLTILPLPDEVRRERDREERVAEQPRAVQEWFDATADDRAMDARLRAFAAALVPGLDAAPALPDPDASLATLDDLDPISEGGERTEAREDAAARRLARQPVVLQEWYDAAAEGGAQDARLRSFAAELLAREVDAPELRGEDTTGSVVPLARARDGRPADPHRWTRWGAAALALAAAGLLVLRVLSPGQATTAEDAARASIGSAPDATGSADVRGDGLSSPEVPPLSPGELEALALAGESAPTFAEAAWPSPAPTPRAERLPARPGATVPGAAPSPVVGTAPLADGSGSAAIPSTPAPTALVVASAPSSPPLLSSGEIEADTSPWRGEVVDGLDLRVDQGFGVLSGTQAAPVLALSNDATVRVDVDRTAVEPDFATFTIRTVSATVRVVGTKYAVSTVGSRTEVSTRRGTVQVECADGRRKLVSEGQSASCEPQADPRLLVHMQALDRPPMLGQAVLTATEQYAHLQRQRQASTPSAFVATADVMLGRALASADLRQALEAVRVDAMCDLGWEGPARRAARAWVEGGGQVERERVERIADQGCEAR